MLYYLSVMDYYYYYYYYNYYYYLFFCIHLTTTFSFSNWT